MEAGYTAAGMDWSPASIDDLSARIDALSLEHHQDRMILQEDLIANEAPSVTVSAKNKFAQGKGESAVTLTACADDKQSLAPWGVFSALCGFRYFAASRTTTLQRIHSRLLNHAIAQNLCSQSSTEEHGAAVAELLAATNLPPRLRSLSSALEQPLAAISLRLRYHQDDQGRGDVLAARLHRATLVCPFIEELLGPDVSDAGAIDHLKLLGANLGIPTGTASLASLDALEVALAPLSGYSRDEGSISYRIAAITDAFQRNKTALATVASAALSPHSSSNDTSDSTDSIRGRSGPAGIPCLQAHCATQLNVALQSPRLAPLTEELDGVPDVVALGIAFRSGDPALFQIALSKHATIVHDDSRLLRVARARTALTRYFGRAMFFERGAIAPGGDVYCINEAVANLLRSGDLSFDMYNLVVAPYRAARFASVVTKMTLEEVLGDVPALFSLRHSGGLLLTALGYDDGICSFEAMLGDVCHLLGQAPPNARSRHLAARFFNIALDDATRDLKAFLYASPDALMPVFYPKDSPARSFLQNTRTDFNMLTRVERTLQESMSMFKPALHSSTLPAAPPALPRPTRSPPSAAAAAQSATTASTANSDDKLSNIGRGSKLCSDDGTSSFSINNCKYNSGLAIAAFPELSSRCKCVVGSHAPSRRERLCPHWDAATQTGDVTHNVVNTGVHEPITGLSGVKDALDFAKQ